MVRIIEDEAAIRRGQRQFVKNLKPFADEKITVKLGHPGASFKAGVFWSERLGIWFFSRKMSEDRYWNVFGIGRPAPGDDISITCEINFPVRGIDRKTGGALARDNAGRVFVVHRGKIGGGKKGIGKTLFESHYRGVWATVEDGAEENTVTLIGLLGSPHCARQIAQFVRKIDRIKTVADNSRRPQMEISFAEHDFREELIGAKYGKFERDLEAECDHDLVVRDLSEALKRDGCPIANDGRCDLFILDGGAKTGQVAAVFEVRTDLSLVGLQAGITRLLLAGLNFPGDPQRILVVPAGAEAISGENLRGLKITLVTYEWRHERAVFQGLSALLYRA
ncbi:MAG: hypothetical protein HY742_04030 [Deltaproteobacteria bacterium]|nr:hypothetical protein [Deltaproteobacteria bacterium]